MGWQKVLMPREKDRGFIRSYNTTTAKYTANDGVAVKVTERAVCVTNNGSWQKGTYAVNTRGSICLPAAAAACKCTGLHSVNHHAVESQP